jgi:uncharacterized protein YfeS
MENPASTQETTKKHTDVLKRLQENLSKEDNIRLAEFKDELEDGIDDIEYAREYINAVRKLTPPIISVPKKYIDTIKKQQYISPRPTWTGHKILAATLNRTPYIDSNDRIFFAIRDHVPLEPRFTGEPQSKTYFFKGVVMVSENFGNLNINNDLVELSQ